MQSTDALLKPITLGILALNAVYRLAKSYNKWDLIIRNSGPFSNTVEDYRVDGLTYTANTYLAHLLNHVTNGPVIYTQKI